MCFVGLDVSLDTVAAAVVDLEGSVLAQAIVPNQREAILHFIASLDVPPTVIGVETGSFGEWIVDALRATGLRVVNMDARHAEGFLSTRVNKTDESDALGLASMLRFGHFSDVHVKSPRSTRARAVLLARKCHSITVGTATRKVRALLRRRGLMMGHVPEARFEDAAILALKDAPDLRQPIESLLHLRGEASTLFRRLDEEVRMLVETDPVCELLMSAPGVGPVCSLTFRSAVDDPTRFARSSSIGPYFGMTSKVTKSGKSIHFGPISKKGDKYARTALFRSASILFFKRTSESWLKHWGEAVRLRRGYHKAVVATGRLLGVTLHRMWSENLDFQEYSRRYRH